MHPFKDFRSLFLHSISAVIAFWPCLASGMQASPHPIEIVQPDGSKITLRARGDENAHWFEDMQGYTVVRDSANRYVFANRGVAGALAPTGLQVGKINPLSTGLQPGIEPDRNEIRQAAGENEEPAASSQEYAGPERVPPQGNVKNLVILCKFADHVFGTHTRAAADYDVLFNGAGPSSIAPTGSVRDYYLENSYGTMNLQSTVVAWVTLPNNEAYYADGKDGTDGIYPKNAQGMVRDALIQADALVDFGQFDQDNNGFIDSISIIHSGYAAETGGGNGNWIWSHRWSLYQVSASGWVSADNNALGAKVKVYDYHTEAALWGTSGTGITRIGVVCHETGHFFGLPDLYDTNYSSSGLGSWCLMANSWGFDGSQLRPPHFSAWCKVQLGWVTPTVVLGGVQTAPRVQTSPTIFKVTNGYPAGEYLLIENRQPYGYDSQIPQGGLAIWHIDENKPNNTDEGYPGQSGWPANNRHYKIALLQADGLYHLEKNSNDGDSGDLYRAGGTSAITPATVPGTDRYQGGTVASSGNFITAIGPSSEAMAFTLNGGGTVPVITSGTSVNAEPGLPFSYQTAATFSPTGYGASGLPGGLAINPTSGLITGTPTMAQTSTVVLSATNASGTGTATLTITVATNLTLTAALDSPGLNWTRGGDANWTTQTSITHDGVDAAKSGKPGNSQESWLETVVTGPGTVTFWWKVSSEQGYDYLRFRRDGGEIAAVPAISGTVDWQLKTVGIPTGSHTLRWTYAKDGSSGVGSDVGWLDEVIFTPETEPPVINSVAVAIGTAGQPLGYQITATNNPTVFAATGLPAGLNVNTSTGLISGVPTTAGFSSATVSASNGFGPGTATVDFTIQQAGITLPQGLDTVGYNWSTGGSAGWAAQTGTSHDGVDAAQSGILGDSQESSMETIVTGPAALSFWWRVSSEPGYDFLRFRLDGIEQAGVTPISGSSGWQQKFVTIPPGTHTLRWSYSKDYVYASGSDAGWVDQVVIDTGITGPEIVIERPGEANLTDGASSVVFGGTKLGNTAGPVTFTVTNIGNQNLTGLALSLNGANAPDFILDGTGLAAVLTPGAQTTFKVSFAPSSIGPRTAAIHLTSNDTNENPFDIILSETGTSPSPLVNFQSASVVIGQTGFGKQAATASQSVTPGPSGCAISSTGKLAVCDKEANRVLIWNSIPTESGVPADVVVGQTDFANIGIKTSLTRLTSADGVAFSPDGTKLLVSDGASNRVLVWNSIPTTNGKGANVVIGQVDFASSSPGTTGRKFNQPAGLAVTPAGKLLIADRNNNRIMIYNSIPTVSSAAADVVIGQLNKTSLSSGSAAHQLKEPWDVALNSDGRVLVVDKGNHRVLIYNSIPTADGASAATVIGQPGFGLAGYATTSGSFNNPLGLDVAPTGQLAVSDFGNNRVLIFESIPTVNGALANTVLGQPDFTSAVSFNGGVNIRSMAGPYSPAFAPDGRLLIPGRDMNRVMIFGTPGPEIGVEQPLASTLADGTGILEFGTVNMGNTSGGMTVTVKNHGAGPLNGLAILKDGTGAADFTVDTGSMISSLAPNGTTTFTVNFSPLAAGSRSAALRISSNDLDENPFDITLNGAGRIVYTALENWRQVHFGTPANSGDSADLHDYDHDGLVNLIEFAFGLNPKESSATQMPPIQMLGNQAVIAFTPPDGVAGVTYAAQWSPSLDEESWLPVSNSGTGTNHAFSTPMAGKPKVFMRLVITSP